MALVDTGSTVSLIKQQAAIEMTTRGIALETCDMKISTLSTNQVSITHKISVEIKAGTCTSNGHALIHTTNQFAGHLLIGSDLLHDLGAAIDYKLGGVMIGGKLHRFHNRNSEAEVTLAAECDLRWECIARISGNCGIHARRAVLMELKTHCSLEGKMVAVVPLKKYDGWVASTICQVRRHEVQVVMLNTSENTMIWKDGTQVATVHEIFEEQDDQHSTEEQVLCMNEELSGDNSLALQIDNIDTTHLEEKTAAQLKELLWKYRAAMAASDTDIGHVKGVKHTIRVTDETPICVPQWRLPHSTKKIVEEHVAKMLKAGVIEPSKSAWSAPVVMVKKPSGSYRVCIDYRRLNDVTLKEAYPIPNIVESVETASGHEVYSVIDSASAYHQIPLDPASRKYTAFRTDSGAYQFLRLPMGAKNSSAAYQATACAILKKHLGLGRYSQCFQDDVCLYSQNYDEHLLQLEQILNDLQSAGMKIGLDKCKFMMKEVKFLGHIISAEGTKPDPKNVSAMANFPRPTTVRKIRQFMGAVGYYKRFIPELSRIANPLTQLTKKGARFRWTPEHDAAFETLKRLLTESPILKAPDFSKTFRLHTDASKVAIGSVLNQEHEGKEYPVAYYSRKLRGAELNYAVSEIEALAVVDSVKHFHPYLAGYHFIIITDHTALKYIFKNKNSSNSRLVRWALCMSQYDYKIEYKEGATHHVPDALSRNPCDGNVELDQDVSEEVFVMTAEDEQDIINEAQEKLMRENIITEQDKDLVWGPILRFISGELEENVPRWAINPDFYVEEGLLHKRCTLKRPERTCETIVIPDSLKRYALIMVHDSKISGHQGAIRTGKRASNAYFWVNMLTDVNNYVKSCEKCQRRKVHGRIIPPMGEFPEITRPLERVGVDLTELPVSSNGYKYIMTIVDHLTKYLVTYPLRTKSTEEVTKRFMQYVTTYGAIENLVSDRGTEVTSVLFQEVCKRLGTTSRTTTIFRPQGNGQVEVYNRILKNTLAQLAETDRMTWDQSLPYATFAINTSYQTVVENTPFYLFFGRDAYFPFSDAFKPPRVDYTLGENYAAEVTARMCLAFKLVREKMKRAHDKTAKRHDKRVNSSQLQPGSIVWVKNERQAVDNVNEWPARYVGPYRILQLNKTNARIKHIYKKGREEYVHIARLKFAHIRDDPFPIQEINEELQNDLSAPEADIEIIEETTVGAQKERTEPQRYNLRRR